MLVGIHLGILSGGIGDLLCSPVIGSFRLGLLCSFRLGFGSHGLVLRVFLCGLLFVGGMLAGDRQ